MSEPIRGNWSINVAQYDLVRTALMERGATWDEATAKCMEIASACFADDVRSAGLLVFREFARFFNVAESIKPADAQNSQARGTE